VAVNSKNGVARFNTSGSPHKKMNEHLFGPEKIDRNKEVVVFTGGR